MLAVACGSAWGADLSATPSTLASVYASAQGGDAIHLAAGNYGDFAGGSKPSPVTLAGPAGAVATIAPSLGSGAQNLRFDGLTIAGAYTNGSRNVTFVNSRFTGMVRVDTPANVTNANILFDNDTFDGISATPTSYEGRLTVRGYDNGSPVGVKITNSHFGAGGCSDGVQIIGGANGVQIGPGNEFSGIRQGTCVEHSDAVQLYGSQSTLITDNYFHDNSTGVMAGDGGSGEQIIGNVFVMDEYPWAVVASHIPGLVIRHNTVVGGSLHIDDSINPQSSSTPSTGSVIDNVASVTVGQSGPLTVDYNLDSGASGAHSVRANPQFTGGARPTTLQGFTLVSGSPGTGAASDDTDIGIGATGGTSPPPPPTDTTPPDTTITSGPTGTSTDSTPTFAFTATEAGSVFECRVDSGAWANCTSPWTTSALSDGAHSVAVRATDVAGNTDASPATRSFTVATAPPSDTTPPDTAITSGPTGTTSSTSASFSFTATESGSTFECKVDAGAYAGCTSPKDYSELSAGSHTFSVRATDSAANTDATPATRTWTVQDAPPADQHPVAAFTASPPSPTTGQAVSFDASGATCGDAPCTYTWEDDGPDGPAGDQWPLGSGKTMTFTFQGEGIKYVRLTITDTDGDTDTAMKPIKVAASPAPDPTAPDTTITSGPTGTTTSTTPSFAFTSSEEASAFECRLDSGAWLDCTSPWTTTELAEGPHTVSVRATDAAGNTDASPATRTFTVTSSPASDITPPDTTIASGPDGPTNDTTPTFVLAASEPGSVFACQIDFGAAQTCDSPWTTPVLADGQHRVAVSATDPAGNTDATPATQSFSVDTRAPDTTIDSAPAAVSSDASATLSFHADEPGVTFECRLDWRDWADCTSPKTYTGLTVARHYFAVRATDAAGNVEAYSARARWSTVAG